MVHDILEREEDKDIDVFLTVEQKDKEIKREKIWNSRTSIQKVILLVRVLETENKENVGVIVIKNAKKNLSQRQKVVSL